jgi:c-di-GMP phosphodiesterase
MARVSAPRLDIDPEGRDHDASAAPAVVARQGIYDSRLRLVAYELLFRPTSADGVQLREADAATAQVLFTAFSDIGLDKLVGAHRAFVNIPYAFLTNGYCQTLPTDRVVLEILEDVDIDSRVIDTARALVAGGHTLALDDFVFRDGIEPLVELAEIVKLDVLALTPRELAEHVERLLPYEVKLLAEKVETAEQIDGLRDMGFTYFQGYALQRPTTVRGQATGVNRTSLLQVLAEVNDPDATAAGLVDTVSRDPAIAYALLRILNSAYLSLTTKVDSLRQALVLLGMDGLRNWTSMMVMSRLAPDAQESLSNALIRAKMCELSAPDSHANGAVSFTAGLLSALPDTLQLPLDEIVGQLALAPELRTALLAHEGPVGRVLGRVLAYETGDQRKLAELGAPSTIANTFVEAVEWSTNLTQALARTRP